MHRQPRGTCPDWCVADHAADDEGGPLRHRTATTVVPGIALSTTAPHVARAVELLIEVHAVEGDPLVAVYIGDGVEGIDVTVETAQRLVGQLSRALAAAGAGAQPSVAPKSRPRP